MNRFLAGALLAAAFLPAAPAFAQDLTTAQSDEAFCVAIGLEAIEDPAIREALAMVYVDDELTESMGKIAGDALKPTADACTARYKWTPALAGHAINVALLDQAIWWLDEQTQQLGAPASLTKSYATILNSLDAQEEIDALMLGHWRDDAALTAKMRRILIANGVPDEDLVIEMATILMGNIQAYATESERFINARFGQ